MLMYFFQLEKQTEIVGFQQYFEMMEHVIEFVHKRSRRSMNSPMKKKYVLGSV